MNTTQIQTTVAPLVTFFAGLLAGKGVFGFDAATWATLIGGVVGLAATIWAAFATKQANLVSQVATMPEVKEVKLEATASSALLNSTPPNVTK